MKAGSAAVLLLTLVYLAPFASPAQPSDEQLVDYASPYTVPFSEYISASQLPAGRSLPLATLNVRICGQGLLYQNGSVNKAFIQDVSELPAFSNNSSYFFDILRAAPAEPAPSYYATAEAAIPEESSALNTSSFEGVEVQMALNFFRNAYLVDFGATLASLHAEQLQVLRSFGWTVAHIVQEDLTVSPAAMAYLKKMPLPATASYNFTLQVLSNTSLCCEVGSQGLLLSAMDELLANQTNLITLRLINATDYEDGGLSSYPFSTNFTFVMSLDVYSPIPGLETALNQILPPDAPAPSLFTQAMLNRSINATATAGGFVRFPGDSFSEQVADYVEAEEPGSGKKVPLGWPIGVSLGVLAILGAALLLGVCWWHQRRKIRRQQAKLDADSKLDGFPGATSPGLMGLASTSSGSHSGQLSSIPVVGIPSSAMSSGAGLLHAWDMDPAEIAVCKQPDGSDLLLGTGSFGQVVKGIRGGVQDVALKMLLGDTHYHVNSFRQEIEILKSLSFDRNIVQFYGTCPWNGKTMLVLEFMEGGDLRQALTAAPAELYWYNKGASVALDIIKGLHFLHKHKVIHMDMKPKNVLLTADYSIAKVADVGLAHIMEGSQAGGIAQGTFAYAAPEQLLNQPCDEKVDIYSFGVLLWELVTATPPMRGRLRPIKVPIECPQEIADLVELCLGMEPQTRPSARDVFDVISKVKTAQDQQSGQDPWQPDDSFFPHTPNPAAAHPAAPIADMSTAGAIDMQSTTSATPVQCSKSLPEAGYRGSKPEQQQSVQDSSSNHHLQDEKKVEEMV